MQTIFNNSIPDTSHQVKRMPPREGAAAGQRFFDAAEFGRFLSDWITSTLSTDQEIRRSLLRVRSRSRDLAFNDDYMAGFLKLLKKNVVGPQGIRLQSRVEEDELGLSDEINEAIEGAFEKWAMPQNCCVDQRLSWIDAQNLFITSLATDGEVFIQKVKGYPYNDFKYALRFIDAYLVDVNLNRSGLGAQNDIRMGIEVDKWRRPVAYYVLKNHPADVVVGFMGLPIGDGQLTRYIRIPADEMLHTFVVERSDQTRGIPWLHAAMTRLRHLGQYEEAELIASRISAMKMGFITSKTGDEYSGVVGRDGKVEVTLEPGNFEQLPEGMNITQFDPQHPNASFGEFVKAMLRGMAAGVGVSYASLAEDLREVNFSSIRQGVLSERDTYRGLQTFMIEHFCRPVFSEWLGMALLAKQIPGLTSVDPADYDETEWMPRGWEWVDPLKDANSNVIQIGAGFSTLSSVCAQRGLDWRDVLRQRKKEQDTITKLGVQLEAVQATPNSEADQTLQDEAGAKGAANEQ
jgi:lambda family phage portal protein